MKTPIIGATNTVKKDIKPFHDQILMEAIETSNKTEGGLIIPEAHITPVNQGKVLEKGPLCSESIVVGDILFFPLHTESRLKFGGRNFILCGESNILGAIREIK